MKRSVKSRLPTTELGHVPISELHPSPENDQLYRPVDPDAPDIIDLAKSIAAEGVLEPLVVTSDGWIVSGHRRYVAAQVAGLVEVPCRILSAAREDDLDGFVKLLREHNRQREKSHDERVRECLVDADPVESHRALVEHRRQQSEVSASPMVLGTGRGRAAISKAKEPFLTAIRKVLRDRQKFWPLSDRQIHYALLNDPPLRHASKPDSTYENNLQCYKSLVELLTRARLTGDIPMNAIADETRPVSVWNVHKETTSYVRDQLDNFLKGFYRDLMQSQPNQIELIGEKNTIGSILRPIAAEYCIPFTTGRGYCSLPPRAAIADRYKRSGKTKLVLLIASDFDPDGEEIAHSFARSMRDDFGITEIHPVKVALTADQVREYKLPPVMTAKETSVHHGKFTDAHGQHVFELEALPPDTLQAVVKAAIDSVINIEAFNAEVDREREDAAHLDGVRKSVHGYLGKIL